MRMAGQRTTVHLRVSFSESLNLDEVRIMFIILYCIGLAAFVKFWGMDMLRDPKSAGIFIAVAVVGLFLAVEINSIPKKLRARKKLAHLTERTEGRITNHYEDTYQTRDEEGRLETRSRGMVIFYEFEVGETTYKGSGYGSWAFGKTKQQTICYDPNNPDDNLPLADYNSQTKTHFFGSLLYLAISAAFFYGVFKFFFWIMGN